MSTLFKKVVTADAENPVVGDIQFRNGQFVSLPEGSEMLEQRIRSRLLWLQGEWYIDQRQGTPWRKIWGKQVNAKKTEKILRKLIEDTPGVGSVTSLTAVPGASRSLAVNFEAVAEEGYVISISDLDLPYGVDA